VAPAPCGCLRLGHKVGDYRVADTSQREIVAAILGASTQPGRRPIAPTVHT
jgi:hypothetical protein